jgi:carbon monoxide dehydrogenase subunit G
VRIEQEVRIDAPLERAWSFLTDLPLVSQCVPDIEAIEAMDSHTVAGTIKIRVGPIGLRLVGRVKLAQLDPENHQAVLEIEAADRRLGGGIAARTTFRLIADTDAATILHVATDVTLLGRLGQFGQPIIRRKSDEMAKEFASNVAAALSQESSTT